MKKINIITMLALLTAGMLYTGSAEALTAFKNAPAKEVNDCADTKVLKVTDEFSFCMEPDGDVLVDSITFINCSDTIYRATSCDNPSDALGSSDETYVRIHVGAGHSFYDIFIVGPESGYYLEGDNDIPDTYQDKKDLADFKMKNFKDARNCLKKMLKTSGAKCSFSVSGVSEY